MTDVGRSFGCQVDSFRFQIWLTTKQDNETLLACGLLTMRRGIGLLDRERVTPFRPNMGLPDYVGRKDQTPFHTMKNEQLSGILTSVNPECPYPVPALLIALQLVTSLARHIQPDRST